MRRSALTFLAPLALCGCVHLGAKSLDFTCGDMLAGHSETYQATPLFAELQRDAGLDDCAAEAGREDGCAPGRASSLAEAGREPDAMVAALERRLKATTASSLAPGAAPAGTAVLMLSGGGGWGAFGAGFLRTLGRDDWAVVTGVSTGSLQGIYVAAGDYAGLAKAYGIQAERDLARTRGVRGLLFDGAQYDTAPLKVKLMAYLLPATGLSPLSRLAEPGRPDLFIAMVEARSGDLRAVHVTGLVRDALPAGVPASRERLAAVAECVAGVAMASSSIPVRLTPVRIDGRTYMDGGVRSSVFDAGVGRRVARFARRLDGGAPPHVHVVRNGPTVVFQDPEEPGRPGVAAVDARPDALRVGMRGYSTIVNQNELMSIAALRLNYPVGPISVATADGFDSPANSARCGPRPEALFDPAFMECLIAWGATKAASGRGWIELGTVAATGAPAAASRP